MSTAEHPGLPPREPGADLTSPKSEDDRQVGLVGYGRWGQVWAKLLNAESVLSWIVDTDPKMQARARYEYPHVTVHDEIPLWEAEYTNGAVVATPPAHHVDPAVTLLEHRVPVLVEKPMALTPEDANAMVEASVEYNTRLMVDHTFLGALCVQDAFANVEAHVGTVRHSRYVWQNRGTDRTEDALWNLMPHPLSISLAFAHRRNARVKHFVVNHVSTAREGVADCVDLTLVMTDHSIEHLHVSNFGPEKVREFTVVGDKGAVVCRPTQHETETSPVYSWRAPGRRLVYTKYGDQPLRNILNVFMGAKPLADEHGQGVVNQIEILHRVSQSIYGQEEDE